MSLSKEDLELLEYVYDQADGDLDESVDVWSTFERERWGAIARRLQNSDLIKLASIADDYKITTFGLNFVSELRAKRRNGPARMNALRLALIHWLYDHHLEGTHPESTEDFHTSSRNLHMGRPFEDRELLQAISYVLTARLVDGVQVDQSRHLFRPFLTPKGVDCAESEKTVSDFLNPPPANGPTFNVRIDGSQNVVVGTQSGDFTQNSTSGIDPEVLARITHFANVARQGISSYGLEEDQQVEVEQIAQELEAEATGETPDRGRLRRLTDRLVEAIAPAAGSALGGMVMALGEQASSAIAG